jgi:hypothetical protein
MLLDPMAAAGLHTTIHEETEIQQIRRVLSLADTQKGRYGRLYSIRRLGAKRSCRRSSLLACSDPSRTSPLSLCTGLTLPYAKVPRVNAYSGSELARARPEGSRYLST